MKNGTSYTTLITAIFLLAIGVGGCAKSTDPAAETLKEMEKKLTQLKAENSNLNSRVKSMDDKLMVFEKKEDVSASDSRKEALRTVRLSPGSSKASYGEQPAQEISLSQAPAKVTEDADRPTLRLVGEDESSAPMVTSPGSVAPVQPVATRSYADIPTTNRGDNLGVVSGKSQPSMGADPMSLFHSAYRSYNNRDYGAALAGFSTFLQKESSHPYADNAMFWMGECFLAQGKSVKAIGVFERLLRRYPGSEKAGSALYRIGFVYDKLNDATRAQEYYFKVVERYPNTEAARKASRRMSGSNGGSNVLRTSARR